MSGYGDYTSPLLVRFTPQARERIREALKGKWYSEAEFVRRAVDRELDEVEEAKREREKDRESTRTGGVE